jgi:hypothetical protein
MIKKAYKTVERQNGTVTFYGANREQKLYYNADYTRQYFIHYGTRHYLDEFINIHNSFYNPNPPDYMLEFDGYINDTFFSGVVVKLLDDETCKAFTFIS